MGSALRKTLEILRYVFISPFPCKQVRYQELETRRDGVKFTSKALKEAAIRLQQLSGEYDSRQQHLVEQVGGGALAWKARS